MEKTLVNVVDSDSKRNYLHSLRERASLNSAEISIVNTCNLRCRHCSYTICSNGHSELGVDEWISVVRQMFDLGLKYLHICGKEPLLCTWLPQLLDELDKLKTRRRFVYGLVTNGTLLVENLHYLSSSHLDYVDISVDGLQSGHDYLRGSGMFINIIKHIEAAIEALGKCRVNLSTVIYSHNVTEIPEMIDFFHHMGIRYFFLQPVQMIGRAMLNPHLRLSEEAFLQLVHCLASRKVQSHALIEMFVDYKYKKYLFNSCEMFRKTCRSNSLSRPLAFRIPMGELQLTTNWNCQSFWNSCMITPFGHFLGCCRQATDSCYIGPDIGFVTEFPIRVLFEKSLKDESLGFFHMDELGNNKIKELSMMGITDCPVEQVLTNKSQGGN